MGLLRSNPTFRTLMLAFTISSASVGCASFSLPVAYIYATHNLVQTAFLTTTNTIGNLCGTLVGGVLADAYSPRLIREGLKVMIGKGLRNAEVVDALKQYTGVFFAAI